MKTAPIVVFLFKDADGFATAILDSLQPNPNSNFEKRKDSFDLSLERYGIKDSKASGSITHFIDPDGVAQVSILLLESYEPPILACAINEVMGALAGENALSMPLLILPFLLDSSKLKMEIKHSTRSHTVYGIQIGPETDMTKTLLTKTQRPHSSLQIHHEPLSCSLHLVRVLSMPSFFIIGQRGEHLSGKTPGDEIEVICEIGERLASILSMRFLRDEVTWKPTKTSREYKEPWRALYG